MTMYVLIVLVVLVLMALMALSILVKMSSVLLEKVDGIMANLAYMHRLMQAVDHKVSKQFGWQDGDKEYIDELVKKEYDKIVQEEKKEKK